MALALEDRIAVACRALGRSVVALNPRAREQAAEKNALDSKYEITLPLLLEE